MSPPFVVIEILSESDRMTRMQERIGDYLQFGPPFVWVIDPSTRHAWNYTSEGAKEAKDDIRRTQSRAVELPLPEIFGAIDAENAS
jgi:Uma2 family endonuclease